MSKAGFAGVLAVLGDLSQPDGEPAVRLSDGKRRQPCPPHFADGRLRWLGRCCPPTPSTQTTAPLAGVDACAFTGRPVQGSRKGALEMPGTLPGARSCPLQAAGGNTRHFGGHSCSQAAEPTFPGILAGLRRGLTWDVRSVCRLQAAGGSSCPSLQPCVEGGIEDRCTARIVCVCGMPGGGSNPGKLPGRTGTPMLNSPPTS